jgi:hypothetical protein
LSYQSIKKSSKILFNDSLLHKQRGLLYTFYVWIRVKFLESSSRVLVPDKYPSLPTVIKKLITIGRIDDSWKKVLQLRTDHLHTWPLVGILKMPYLFDIIQTRKVFNLFKCSILIQNTICEKKMCDSEYVFLSHGPRSI